MSRIISYANVASTLALVLAVSGGAYAAATITGKDVKDGSLTGKDVRDRSLLGKDLKAGGLTGAVVKDGSLKAVDLAHDAFPGAGAVRTTGGAVPQGPQSSFMFDAESYDTGGMYNAPDAFVTVPRTGTYLLTGAITFGDVSGASVQTRLVVNGTVVAITHSNASPAQITLPISKVLPLTAGDQVALGTFSSIGTATVINFSGTVPDAWLDVQMVSP